jgi:hypothetical protein
MSTAASRPSRIAQTISDAPRRASPTVPDTIEVGPVVAVRRQIPERVERESRLLQEAASDRTHEPDREEHEVDRELELGPRYRRHGRPLTLYPLHVHSHSVQIRDPTALTRESRHDDTPLSLTPSSWACEFISFSGQ